MTAGAGVTGNGSASVTITGTAAQINAALAGLAYTGNLNFNGGDTLTVATSDGTATDTDTIAITVNPVNDAPVNTVPGAQSVAEDTTLPIAGVSVADIDSSALTTTLNVSSGTLNVTAGAGVTGNGTASVTITGTAAQINAALAGLAYTGNLNFNGGDTLTVATSDGTATDTDTVAITVNAVNDAPVNTVPGAQSVAEDTTLPIAGVSVADIDSSALTTTLSVASGILNVTAGAGVTGNGTASVTITGTAAQINAALAGLAYTGNLNFNGADTLTVATSDGTATDTDTIAITVNPVNDAPVNTVPGAQSVAEDTILPIAGVSVADIDSSALTTTLSVVERHPQCDRRRRRHRQRQRQRNHRRHGSADQRGAGGPRLYRQPQLQRRRHAHGRDQRRDRHRHRHDRDHCQSSERRARARRCGRNLPGGCPGIAFAISQPHRRGRHRARLRRRADHRRVVSGDGDSLTVNGATSGTLTGITFLWDPTLHALVFTGASSVANYQALLQTVQFQSTSHNPTDFDSESATDPDLVRIGWHGRHDRNDDTRYRCPRRSGGGAARRGRHHREHRDPRARGGRELVRQQRLRPRQRSRWWCVCGDGGVGRHGRHANHAAVGRAADRQRRRHVQLRPQPQVRLSAGARLWRFQPDHVDTFSYAITGGDTATVTVTVSGVDTNDVLYDSAVASTAWPAASAMTSITSTTPATW